MISEDKLKELIGVVVRHELTLPDDTVEYEYGRIVEAWFDQQMCCVDCRIQIFENSDPVDTGELLPGTLRYFLSNLTPIDESGEEIEIDRAFYAQGSDE